MYGRSAVTCPGSTRAACVFLVVVRDGPWWSKTAHIGPPWYHGPVLWYWSVIIEVFCYLPHTHNCNHSSVYLTKRIYIDCELCFHDSVLLRHWQYQSCVTNELIKCLPVATVKAKERSVIYLQSQCINEEGDIFVEVQFPWLLFVLFLWIHILCGFPLHNNDPRSREDHRAFILRSETNVRFWCLSYV